MIYVVDTVEVAADQAADYVRLVESKGVPVMTEAGARFVACWTTSAELGEPVRVKTIWSCNDHIEWNVIRKNMVLDPRWYEFSSAISMFWRGGDRRFYYPTAFSPQC